MTMTAKYSGKCAFCGGYIGRGDRMDYEGGKTYHPCCRVVDDTWSTDHDNHTYTVVMEHNRHGLYTVTLRIWNKAGDHTLEPIKGGGIYLVDYTAKYRNTETMTCPNAANAKENFTSAIAYVKAEWPKVIV